MNTPKISIVTVTYNCKDTIEQTIRNVLSQTYPSLEYIIIDGGSTDGTRDIIEQYAEHLAYWVSEPDKGIYDAMNKGLQAATGQWILFRNSGDYFAAPTVVEDVFSHYEDRGEFCIAGRTRFFENDGYFDSEILGEIQDLWAQPYFSHPSTFIRTEVMRENPYPTDLRIAGDYYFFQKMLCSGRKYVSTPILVSLFDNETGVSSRNRVISAREKFEVAQRLHADFFSQLSLLCKYCYVWCVIKVVMNLVKDSTVRNLQRRKRAGWHWQPASETLKAI